MDLIAAVYSDWGLGRNGTQPTVLKADRAFFKRITDGKIIVVGSTTINDFKDKKPLKGRVNVVLSRSNKGIPGFLVASDTKVVHELDRAFPGKCIIIGGAKVYASMMPMCDRAYITKIQVNEKSDRYFYNLDTSPYWEQECILGSGTENGLHYEIVQYKRISDGGGKNAEEMLGVRE